MTVLKVMCSISTACRRERRGGQHYSSCKRKREGKAPKQSRAKSREQAKPKTEQSDLVRKK